ncbi:MAG: DNA-directed RNA polymerase subunit omega [Acidimicrobiaceae bacterium]|nr:DNA-directed RNA polymerase subunit omega [Acidimicrobiaceae bacterium]
MAHGYDTMMNPPIEGLLEDSRSKFRLVILAARRSREITAYLGQLSRGQGSSIPPQVASTASKPLSIALEEIAARKIVPRELEPQADTAISSVDRLLGA